MKTSKIKADCLIAFIHSRLIGLGMNKNEENIQLAFEDKNISEKARYYGNYFEKKLEKICTFDKVQNYISNGNDFKVCDMYFQSYTKLTNIMDKYAPKETLVIEGLIALNILSLYLEYWNEHKMKDYFDRLTSSIVLYEKNVNDDVICKEMQDLAENVYKDYSAYSKIKYDSKEDLDDKAKKLKDCQTKHGFKTCLKCDLFLKCDLSKY